MNCYNFNFGKYLKSQVKLVFNYRTISALNNKSNKTILNYDDFSRLAVDNRSEALLKLIICEYNYYRHKYPNNLPNYLSFNDMKLLMNCWKCNHTGLKWTDNTRLERLKLLSVLRTHESSDGHNQLCLPFHIYHNFAHLRNRLRLGALYGQNVAFDLSYDQYMTQLECKNVAEQLQRIFHFNFRRITKRVLPFSLNIVNCDDSGWTNHFIDVICPELKDARNYCNVTKRSYLDLFDRQSLVYLSPDGEQELTEYDHTVCYIFGGIVDRRNVMPLTFNKSKTENIRSMRLPIDKYSKTVHGIQSIDTAFYFLHDLKAISLRNTQIALDKVIRNRLPRKKLKSLGQVAYEQLIEQGIDLNCDFDETEKLISESGVL